MKKLIAPLVISASIFLVAPAFAADNLALGNPAERTNSASKMPVKAGANYAYRYHHRHWHHRHWNRGWHRGWHRWHHRHYYW